MLQFKTERKVQMGFSGKITMAILTFAALIFLVFNTRGCERARSSFSATNFGADWIIVQYRFDGSPTNCWKLSDVSVNNEQYSDGIYWKDNGFGNLVHISGWYNRVQVIDKKFDDAARLIGVDRDLCGNGKYPAK